MKYALRGNTAVATAQQGIQSVDPAARICPSSRCESCSNYRRQKFANRAMEEVINDIAAAKASADERQEWAVRSGYVGRLDFVARINCLTWLHVGLESRNDDILAYVRKSATADGMISAEQKIKEVGYWWLTTGCCKLSIMR